MKTKRKICFVTGSRAEYGLLYSLIKEIQNDSDFQLQITATGMHLSSDFGLTYKQIEADGFQIDFKIDIDLSSDTAVGITKSMGLGVIGFADAFEVLKPDIIIVLGDRFEILSAVQAALIAKIPVAHLCGGDVTEGAFDESIRHAITKMSHLHFVSNQDSANRVLQMGENPEHIFKVGNPGLDYIRTAKLMTRKELEESLDFKFKEKNILVTFHPVTLDSESAKDQFVELLKALDSLGNNVGIIITKPNADNDGKSIIKLIDEYVEKNVQARAFTSLGQLRYLSTMAQIDAVVGNSSSGLMEAPSFKKPTVNIGDRQKGRLQSQSILNSPPRANEIEKTIKQAFEKDCSHTTNPYGDGHTSVKIKNHLKEIDDFKALLRKPFFELRK